MSSSHVSDSKEEIVLFYPSVSLTSQFVNLKEFSPSAIALSELVCTFVPHTFHHTYICKLSH